MFRLPFRRLSISGLFGEFDVPLELDSDCLILVGPNGTGKSTILNILYYVISRQWQKLIDTPFHSITLDFSGEDVTVTRDELASIGEIAEIDYRVISDRIKNVDQLTLFQNIISSQESDFIDNLGTEYRIPTSIIKRAASQFQRQLRKQPSLQKFTNYISAASLPKILYLPTYRRIERDLNSIFPEFQRRLKRDVSEEFLFKNKASDYFTEIISFGMEDVKTLFASALREAKEYERKRITGLAADYLSDVITGRYETFKISEFRSISPDSIDQYISRLQKTQYFPEEIEDIRSTLQVMATSELRRPRAREKQIAFFFSKIASAFDDVDNNTRSIDQFVNVVNSYFDGEKSFIFNETNFEIKLESVKGKEISLGDLSSGEKQIVSLFGHLYLGAGEENIVLIDEPELSLSVIWQEKFLPDILGTGKCRFLGSVTHSPFIFKNYLRKHVRDVQTIRKNGS